jgi:hypothetical protein
MLRRSHIASRSPCSSFGCGQMQAKDLSTTQRRGSTTKPFGGNSFSQSTTTPSCNHCSAHAMSTLPSGQACGDARPAPHSIRAFSPPNPCPYLLPGSQSIHPQMFEAGKGRIRSPQQLFDPVPVHDLGAMDLCLEDETLTVSTSRWRLRPLIFLPPS